MGEHIGVINTNFKQTEAHNVKNCAVPGMNKKDMGTLGNVRVGLSFWSGFKVLPESSLHWQTLDNRCPATVTDLSEPPPHGLDFGNPIKTKQQDYYT
jgi:hypothetical protein